MGRSCNEDCPSLIGPLSVVSCGHEIGYHWERTAGQYRDGQSEQSEQCTARALLYVGIV